VRIACLAILGATRHVGGWLYKQVDAIEAEPAQPTLPRSPSSRDLPGSPSDIG